MRWHVISNTDILELNLSGHGTSYHATRCPNAQTPPHAMVRPCRDASTAGAIDEPGNRGGIGGDCGGAAGGNDG